MSMLYLGKMTLRWCPDCDLPVVEQDECSLCGGKTHTVKHTPPGDVRPAFPSDIELLKKVISSQFGGEVSDRVVGEDRAAILNRLPALDRMDEVIVHGRVVGNLKYEILPDKYVFIPRQYGLELLNGHVKSNLVVVDDGAVPFIKKGANCLAPGVVDVVGVFGEGDEILVTDRSGELLMSGRAKVSSSRMPGTARGVVVKSRRRYNPTDNTKPEIPPAIDPERVWERAVEANAEVLAEKVEKSKAFVRKTAGSSDLPVAVSYSGGKDSLATLLLVVEAGLKPDILFINTGLEFPETVENVRRVADEFDLELVTLDAEDAFYHAMEHFGPPAKDFRWCCKICKLGPATRLIRERYPDGLMSYIGQRQYESSQRRKKGSIWDNPWVPNQKGMSPIQRWNALTVWLYIFSRGAPYNPWYERGLERIGCWLCPASKLADLKEIRDSYPGSERFFDFLGEWAERRGYSSKWVELGLWRWKRYPGTVEEIIERIGRDELYYSSETEGEISVSKPTEEMGLRITGRRRERMEDGRFHVRAELNTGDFREHDMALIHVLGEVEDEVEGEVKAEVKGEAKGEVKGEVKAEVKGEAKGEVEDEVEGEVEDEVEGEVEDEADRGSRSRTRIECRDSTKIEIGDRTVELYGTAEGIKKNLRDALSVLKRITHCQGCGVCMARCPQGALSLRKSGERGTGKRIELDISLCTSCRKCLGPCPVENFDPNEGYGL